MDHQTPTDHGTPAAEERPSMSTAAEMAEDPSKANEWAEPAPNEEYQPPPVAGKAIVETIKAAGIDQGTVRDALHWIEHGSPGFSSEQLAHIDATDREQASAELRGLWGPQYESNRAAIRKVIDALPGQAADVVLSARRADGRALANDPAFLQKLLSLSKTAGAKISGDPEEVIARVEKLMRTDRAAYTRDEPLQARYREALAARAAH